MTIEAEIEQLQREYLETLTEKQLAIHKALDAVLDAADWKDIQHHTHKIAGSAGTYQYMALSEICRYLEDRIVSGQVRGCGDLAAMIHFWKESFDAAVSAYSRLRGKKAWAAALKKVDDTLRAQWQRRQQNMAAFFEEAA